MRVISGAKGGGGGGSSSFTEDANTLRANSIMRFIDILGAGPIQGTLHPDEPRKDYYLDGTPVVGADGTVNFNGVDVTVRYGYPDQDPVEGFPEIETEYSVSTQIKKDAPLVRTITNLDANAVRVTVTVPALTSTNEKGDRMSGSRVDLVVDVRPQNGGWGSSTPIVIEGKNTSEYPVSVRVPLRGVGPWDVRVTRLTADSNTQRLQNATYWTSYTELVEGRYMWPNMAYIATKINAQYFGSSVPTRTWDIYARIIRVPSNYNPMTREYSGIWNGVFKQAWTDNPAWVFFDLLTNKMDGAAAQRAESIKWELYEIARVCDVLVDDGKGGKEPRFTFNGVVDDASDAYSVLQDVASTFNAMSYWAHDAIGVVQDYPQPDDGSVIFTRANVVNGEFNYSSTEYSTRHSVAIVGYTNPETWRTDYATYVDDDAYQKIGWRDTTLTLRGCTSKAMALRRAKWMIDSEWSQDGLVQFSVGRAYMAGLAPGRVISIYDPDRQGLELAGRIESLSGARVVLDRPLPDDLGGDPRFNLVMADDSLHTTGFYLAADRKTLTLDAAPPREVVDKAVWAVSSGTIAPQQFRITSIADNDDGSYTLDALLHDPTKYQRIEEGIIVETVPTTTIPTGPVEPPLSISFRTYLYTSGTSEEQGMTVSWAPSKDTRTQAYQYQYLAPGETAWSTILQTESLSVDVPNVQSGEWSFRVRSSGLLNQTSAWVSRTFTVGQMLEPVAPNRVDIREANESITLTAYGDRVGQEYQFWRSNQPINTEQITSNALLIGSGFSVTDVGLMPGTVYYYYVRGINIHGVSGWVPVQGKTTLDATGLLELLTDKITQTQLGQELLEEIGKISSVDEQLDALNKRLAELEGVKAYDPALAYAQGTIVQSDGKLYRARKDLEAGVPVTDNSAWEYVGDYESVGELVSALNARLNDVSTTVDKLTGEVSAQARSFDVIRAQLRDDDHHGELEGALALANADAQITEERLVRVSEDQALAQRITNVSAGFDDVNSRITTVEKVISDELGGVAERVDELAVTAGENTAAIEETRKAQADTNESLAAMYNIKVGVTQDGRYYGAGMGIGVENTPEGMQSQVLFQADRFAVLNVANGQATAPFVISNGQTIINSAVIGNGSIGSAQIGEVIQSDNYEPNKAGWRLAKNGGVELNATTSDTTSKFTGDSWTMTYNPTGVVVVEISS